MSGSRAGRRWGCWVTAAACATAAGCSTEPSPRSAATPAAPGPSSRCVLELRPATLKDGTDVYVEPQDGIFVGDAALVAGSPSYHWRARPGRMAERLSADAFAAAYLGEPARTVAKPIGGSLGSVRVVALDDRRWAAILLQVDPDSLPAMDAFRGLWYGEFDGDRWERVEAMEFPGGRINSRVSSPLVRAGDRLVWLAWESAARGWGVRFYERIDGAWTHSLIAGEDQVEQVGLAYLEGSGLWMLLSGYDAGLPGFQKSLRLFRETSTGGVNQDRWELVSRVVVAEPGVNLRGASLTVQSSGVTVSWTAIGRGVRRAMARVGIGPDTPGTVVMLDERANYVRPAAMPDDGLIWVVDHVEAGATVPELRILAISGGQVARLVALASPFTGFFAVRAAGPNEVLVVGSEMGSDSTDIPVRSLILRLSTSC